MTGATYIQSGGTEGRQSDLDVMVSNLIGDGSNGLTPSDVEAGWEERDIVASWVESYELNEWASDLNSAKTKRIQELKEHLSNQYEAHVDHHYLKKNRRSERGQSPYSIPSGIEDYEDDLKATGDDMETVVNALTTINEIRNYSPTLPKKPEV